jgi:hypothetical protein
MFLKTVLISEGDEWINLWWIWRSADEAVIPFKSPERVLETLPEHPDEEGTSLQYGYHVLNLFSTQPDDVMFWQTCHRICFMFPY